MDLRLWISIMVVLATLLAVAFPVVWAFSTWNKSLLGRVLMADSLAYAFIMVVTCAFRFWRPDNIDLILALYLIAFIIVVVTNAALLYVLWRINYRGTGPYRKVRLYDGIRRRTSRRGSKQQAVLDERQGVQHPQVGDADRPAGSGDVLPDDRGPLGSSRT